MCGFEYLIDRKAAQKAFSLSALPFAFANADSVD